MNIESLEKILKDSNQPKFRLDQIKKAIYQDGISSFCDISTLPKELRENLDKNIKIISFKSFKVLVSSDKKSIKALLELQDKKLTETVLISAISGTWTACISSQVGCPLGCLFCATGKRGFQRNLTAQEITDQVLFWKQYLEKEKIEGKLTNIVYMGMGEPFLNWEEVKKSLEIFTDEKLFNFGSRSISVSTAGVPEGILELCDKFPQINLAISLHFSDDEKRSRYMPINRKYNLEEIKKALEKYFLKSSRKVFLEYIMLGGINDSIKDAEKLVAYIKSIKKNYLLHVNLIKYNSTSNDFKTSSNNKVHQFESYLLKNKVNCTIRKSLGEEIQGACGQLAGR